MSTTDQVKNIHVFFLKFFGLFSLLIFMPCFLKPISLSFSESFVVLDLTLDEQFASYYKTSLDTDKGIWKTGRIHLVLREKILNVTLRSLFINEHSFLFCINKIPYFRKWKFVKLLINLKYFPWKLESISQNFMKMSWKFIVIWFQISVKFSISEFCKQRLKYCSISSSVAKYFLPMSTSNSMKCVQFSRVNIVSIRLFNQIILVASLLTDIFVNFHIYFYVKTGVLQCSAISLLPM